MKTKGKIIIFASFWLITSALAILAFAGIITPENDVRHVSPIKLQSPIASLPGKPLQLTLEIEDISGPLYASLSLDSGNRHAVIGSLKLPGNLENIHIDKKRQLAYLANSFSGLQIIDISDPHSVELVGAIATPGNAWDIKTRGNILFLAAAKGGLQIYDVSSPENPTFISELTLPKKPLLKLAVHDNTVYASSGKKGLQIIDITHLEAPQFINSLHVTDGAWGLMVDGNHLYLSSGNFHLDIYNLKDPDNPGLISRVDMPGRSWDIALHNKHLLLPTREGGLQIIDIRRVDNPVRLKPAFEPHSVESIDIDGDIALLSNRERELYAYDIADPAAPIENIIADLSFRPRNLAFTNGTAYVASGRSGLQVLDVSSIPPQKLVETLHVPGSLEQFLIWDNYYFLATAQHGLFVARQEADRKLPTIVTSLSVPGKIENMVRIGNYLFLACSNAGLQVVDISRPETPKLTTPLNFPGHINDIVAEGNQIYAATAADGLLVINATFPENPILIGHLNLPALRRLAIKGTRLYGFSHQAGLHIIDISKPANPVEISRCPLPWPLQTFAKNHQMIVDGDTVYLAAGEASLVRFDISNESSPELAEIANIDGETLTVKTDGHSVFATTRQGKLWVFETENARLSLRSVSDILGNCNNIKFAGDGLILANGLKGLSYLPYPQQLAVTLPPSGYSRSRNSTKVTLQVPPLKKPATYNLALVGQEKVTEFVGAVIITEK